jgi:hypothetical protein
MRLQHPRGLGKPSHINQSPARGGKGETMTDKAQLEAAAPELLVACASALACFDHKTRDVPSHVFEQVALPALKAAIKKATGTAPRGKGER